MLRSVAFSARYPTRSWSVSTRPAAVSPRNPAKEAPATDRIYRIGQTRDVHVYYPMALHPDVDSFDVNFDRLLHSKVALSDAVVVPESVSEDEVARALGLS